MKTLTIFILRLLFCPPKGWCGDEWLCTSPNKDAYYVMERVRRRFPNSNYREVGRVSARWWRVKAVFQA